MIFFYKIIVISFQMNNIIIVKFGTEIKFKFIIIVKKTMISLYQRTSLKYTYKKKPNKIHFNAKKISVS